MVQLLGVGLRVHHCGFDVGWHLKGFIVPEWGGWGGGWGGNKEISGFLKGAFFPFSVFYQQKTPPLPATSDQGKQNLYAWRPEVQRKNGSTCTLPVLPSPQLTVHCWRPLGSRSALIETPIPKNRPGGSPTKRSHPS